MSANGSRFEHRGATVAAFADYLESFGLAGKPVLNETGLEGKLFDIHFTFDPENSKTFYNSLREMGLQVKNEKRPVTVYRVRPAQ